MNESEYYNGNVNTTIVQDNGAQYYGMEQITPEYNPYNQTYPVQQNINEGISNDIPSNIVNNNVENQEYIQSYEQTNMNMETIQSIQSTLPTTSSYESYISMNLEGLMASKTKLENTINNIQQIWQNLLANVTKIQESWIGPDATLYIEKVNNMKPKMDATIKVLQTTCRTYDKAINEIQETQNGIKNQIQ